MSLTSCTQASIRTARQIASVAWETGHHLRIWDLRGQKRPGFLIPDHIRDIEDLNVAAVTIVPPVVILE